jgi:hypothetical protein
VLQVVCRRSDYSKSADMVNLIGQNEPIAYFLFEKIGFLIYLRFRGE